MNGPPSCGCASNRSLKDLDTVAATVVAVGTLTLPRFFTEALFCSVREAAEYIEVSDQTVYNKLRSDPPELLGFAPDDPRNPTGEYQVLRDSAALYRLRRQHPEVFTPVETDDPTINQIQLLQADVRERLIDLLTERQHVIGALQQALDAERARADALQAELEAALSAQVAAAQSRLAQIRGTATG